MKSPLILAAFAGVMLGSSFALAASASGAATSISQLTWHQRVLVVFADAAGSAPLAAQRDILAHAPDAMAERDLVLVEVVGDSVKGASDSAAALRHRYGVKADAFRALLIGKDGGVKLDSPQPIALQKLTTTIDAMPMRQQEMRGS
ncbi:DUF4174 domain-containing protein [Paraburkholderia sp. PREW-6R]|uniref:DUF4174 domain-containing protein n=1 Tax=Paraburkholderia sp. PREW-6R TaxID=3141544 RepID=UPI0031F53A4A